MPDALRDLIASSPIRLESESDTLALGARLANALVGGQIIHLHGPLGAGKTTLVRGLLRRLGHSGPVKSPTFTLVENYALRDMEIHHFDLYRLIEPEELEWMGIRDYFSSNSLVLIEWPSKGAGFLPGPDLELFLEPEAQSRIARLIGHDSKPISK